MQSVRPPALFWHALARNTNIYKKKSLTLFAARKEKKKKRCILYFWTFQTSLSNISEGNFVFCPERVLVCAEGWWWWWGVAVVQRRRAVRKAHKLYTQAIQINFEAEVEEISVPTSPEVPRLEKNKYKEVADRKGKE